jgi:hypothetical protein
MAGVYVDAAGELQRGDLLSVSQSAAWLTWKTGLGSEWGFGLIPTLTPFLSL